METYEKMTDEQLIAALRKGESEIMDFIMEKYKYLVRKKAKAMFLLGGENDDLIQEGMIGLFKRSGIMILRWKVRLQALQNYASRDRCTVRLRHQREKNIFL